MAPLRTEVGDNLVGATVLRTIGSVHLVPRVDNTSTATEAAYGLIVGEDTLDAADLLPDTNPDQSWFVYGFLREENVRTTTTITSVGYDPRGTDRFDLRGRRRIRTAGQTLWYAAENGGANTVTVQVYLRYLVALS